MPRMTELHPAKRKPSLRQVEPPCAALVVTYRVCLPFHKPQTLNPKTLKLPKTHKPQCLRGSS